MDHGPMKFQIHLELRGTTSGGWRLFAGILTGAAFLLAIAVLFLFVALGAAIIISAGLSVAMIVVFRRVVGNARRAARARDDLLPSSTATDMLPGLAHQDGGVARLEHENKPIRGGAHSRRARRSNE
jgi:hypothetical protein